MQLWLICSHLDYHDTAVLLFSPSVPEDIVKHHSDRRVPGTTGYVVLPSCPGSSFQ